MKDSHLELSEQIFMQLSFMLTERGRVEPLYVMIMPDESTIPIILPHKMEVTMEMYATVAIEAAKQMKAAAMLLVCEQTMISKKKDDPEVQEILNGTKRPSEHPDSEDYLTLIYMTAGGECESLIAKIHKDPMGTKFTSEKDWMEGSVTSMLQPWKEGN